MHKSEEWNKLHLFGWFCTLKFSNKEAGFFSVTHQTHQSKHQNAQFNLEIKMSVYLVLRIFFIEVFGSHLFRHMLDEIKHVEI